MGPSRPNPLGGWGLRAISLSFVVDDASASPPPLFATSPRKPHPHTSSYLWQGVLVSCPVAESSADSATKALTYSLREGPINSPVSKIRSTGTTRI